MTSLFLEMTIIVPLCAGIACLFLPARTHRVPFLFVMLGGCINVLLALWLFYDVDYQLGGEALTASVGTWEAPLGIPLVLDAFNSLILLLGCFFVVAVFPILERLRAKECDHVRPGFFYALVSFWFAGMVGVIVTGDAFNMFVFLEIMALTSYALIGIGGSRDRRALHSAFSYLVLGSVGASFYLIGVGFLLWETGVLSFEHIAKTLPSAGHNMTVVAASGFMFAGLALKVALFPVYAWLPHVYTNSPGSIATLLAGIGTKIYLYSLIRILFSLFGGNFFYHSLNLEFFLIPMAVLGILLSSWRALKEPHLLKLLSFSSIAHMGYILLGVSLHSVAGLTAAILHFVGHTFAKGTLFAITCSLKKSHQNLERHALNGLYGREPLLAILLTVALLSLVGLPGTFGFMSKWFLVQGIFEGIVDQKMLLTLIVVIAVGTLLSLMYSWDLIERMFLGEIPKSPNTLSQASSSGSSLIPNIPLCVMMTLLVIWGLFPQIWIVGDPLGAAQVAAETLLTNISNIKP